MGTQLGSAERNALRVLLEATGAAQLASLDTLEQDRRVITTAFLDHEISKRVARDRGVRV